jgi:hypothetical protein
MSAPHAARRGFVVSPSPSSAFRTSTGDCRDIFAAIKMAYCDLPKPGMPARTVSLPRGMRPSSMNRTRSGCTSENLTSSRCRPPLTLPFSRWADRWADRLPPDPSVLTIGCVP